MWVLVPWSGGQDRGVRVHALTVVSLCMCARAQAQYEMMFADFKDMGIGNALQQNATGYSMPVDDTGQQGEKLSICASLPGRGTGC